MSGFFGKLKQAFTTKEPPKFKIFEAGELKMIAIRTRVVLETRLAQNLKHITHNDQQFRFVGQDPSKIYNLLQVIGEKVIEVQTMKILIEMMRKVQNLSPQIVKTNGDIALMRKELIWFQCVMWFRRSRQIDNLEQLNKFCWDFFKGVDITTQLDLKCQVFQIYPVLKYLKKGEVLPLREILFYIQPYVSCNIDQNTLDSVFKINTDEIKKKIEENNPNSKHKFMSTIPQNQPNYSQIQNQNYVPHNQANYSNIKPQSNIYTPYTPPIPQNNPYNKNPYESNSGNIGNYQQKNQVYPNNNNPQYNYPNNNPNNYYNNQQQQQSHKYPQNYNNFNPSNSYNNQGNTNFNPYNQSNINNNTFNKTPTQNISNIPKVPQNNPYTNNTLNINPGLNRNTAQNTQPTPSLVQPQANKPTPPKQSFYNSLLRVNSLQQNKAQIPKTEPTLVDKPLNINYDNQREVQPRYNEQFQSAIPFNREQKEELVDNEFERQMRELELLQLKNNLIVQQEIIKRENERKQKQQRERQEREQRQRRQQEAEQIRLEQLRIKQLEEEKKRKEEQQRKLEEEKRIREEQEKKRYIQQQLRIQRQQEERREREEEQRERQYQARRLERQREQRESSEIQLNVFADNEREEIDRGMSGRFSSTIGMKIDFGQNQGEQFNFHSPQQVNSSILRFSKINEDSQQDPKTAEIDLKKQDQQQSLSIIKQFCDNNTPFNFKLFYFKVMQGEK